MIIKELPKDVEFMSLGTNCLALTSNLITIKGPLDNVCAISSKALSSILDNTYLKKLLETQPNVEDIDFVGFYKKCYTWPNLDIAIVHNEYNLYYIKNHIKRLKNLYSRLQDINTYFFLSIPFLGMVEDFKILLEKYNLINRTIVITDEIYKDEFPNVIPLKAFDGDPSFFVGPIFTERTEELKQFLKSIN